MSSQNVISANTLSAGYGKKIIVDKLSFELMQGQILTLIGRNGVGKSTVLKTIMSQLPIISGKIAICGNNIKDMGKKDIAKNMSVVLTQRIMSDKMTCADIVATGRYPHTGMFGILTDDDRAVVKEAMKLTSVESLYDADFDKISDGQKQCVMLARAIAQKPKVMLLDEPTLFLDIGHKLQILSVLRKLVREKNTAVIQSLHELDLAQKFSDMILCIKDGKADRYGTPEEIFTNEYISKLYNINDGKYDTIYGSIEPPAVIDEPRIFVIGGGGTGIKTYRRLQRDGIPFAAGIIHENDIDYPTAKSLACEIIAERAFEEITSKNIDKAVNLMKKCGKVICCLNNFGKMNEGNRILCETAKRLGLL